MYQRIARLLCRIQGHPWVCDISYSLDFKTMQATEHHEHLCTRCSQVVYTDTTPLSIDSVGRLFSDPGLAPQEQRYLH